MTVITDSAALARFCARQEGASFVAVDTEFMRERTYWPILCLVQVAGPEETAAIDALAPGIDLTPLARTSKYSSICPSPFPNPFSILRLPQWFADSAMQPATRRSSPNSPRHPSTNPPALPTGHTGPLPSGRLPMRSLTLSICVRSMRGCSSGWRRTAGPPGLPRKWQDYPIHQHTEATRMMPGGDFVCAVGWTPDSLASCANLRRGAKRRLNNEICPAAA